MLIDDIDFKFGLPSGRAITVDQPIVRLELVGFIYEFMVDMDDEGKPTGDGHTILARYADFVQADGTIATP